MKRILGLLVIFWLGWANSLQAQNFDEIFNAFANQNQQQFNNFVDSINKQFAEAMAANMRAFTGEQPKVRDPKPKPTTVPVIDKGDEPINLPVPKPEVPSIETENEPVPQSAEPETNAEPESNATPKVENSGLTNKLDFILFGEQISIATKPFPEKLNSISAKDVADFWIQLSESDYESLLQKCRTMRKDFAYNDWAVYQLITTMAQQTYPRQYDEQVVMTIFLLNQLGTEAKVGFGNSHLFCLLAIEQQLYGISFCDIASHRYYLFELNPRYINAQNAFSFQTYDTPFPAQTNSIDMSLHQALKSNESFEAPANDSIIHINLNMIELFKTYPQVDMSVYVNASPSKEFLQLLDRLVRPYLRELSQLEAVGLLLLYVQYGFDYATDDEQFGYEKPFFCEENYYYPQNDCEDRSVLFSFLVRHLLHMEVVLIDYPGHMATAVHFTTAVEGESVQYKGKKYIICDPTYIGATIGMEMPDFTPEDRTVVPIDH